MNSEVDNFFPVSTLIVCLYRIVCYIYLLPNQTLATEIVTKVLALLIVLAPLVGN